MLKYIEKGVCAPQGFKAAGIHAGIRKNKTKLDLGVIFSEVLCSAASVHTTNKVLGAPNIVTKQKLANGLCQAIVCNSGNANTCNADGVEKANMMCDITAKALGISSDNVAVGSTGVIGQKLSIEPIENAMPMLVEKLSYDGSDAMASAIMTTDIMKKEFAVEFELDGKICKIGAIAKGSGMIHPNMATLLSYVTSDVAITAEMLKKALLDTVDDTFNMVSVDGDTSTNDMVIVMANGFADNVLIDSDNDNFKIFCNAFNDIMINISKAIARDGEGATKLLTCNVINASNLATAKAVAKSVITSNLLKCAMFANDANWGRILCAIGYAGGEYDINKVDVVIQSKVGAVSVCCNGSGVEFDESFATQVLSTEEVIINVDLKDGTSHATAWGCDLTYDYVKINADYRS